MSDESKPQRRWWRKRRWRIVVALWLASPVFYVLSGGPATYLWVRGWVAAETFTPFYRPLHPVFARFPTLGGAVADYSGWWRKLALRHAGEANGRAAERAGSRPGGHGK